MSKNYELLSSFGKRSEPLQPMLTRAQSRNPRPALLSDAIPAAQSSNLGWHLALNILRRHWRSSACFAAVVFATVTFVAFTQRPLYDPTATIEIDPAETVMGSREGGSSDSNEAEYLETEAKKIESDELLVAVIRSLRLEQNGELVGTGKVSLFSRLNPSNLFLTPKTSAVVERIEQAGSPPQLSNMENIALRNFREGLTIQRDTGSRLVKVTFSSHDPVLGALITNTLVNFFIERSHIERHDAIMESSVWLSKQLDDVRHAMQESNAALAAYEKAWGIVDLGENEKQNSFTERMTELNHQLTQAQVDRIQQEAYLNGLQSGSEASLQQVGNDPVIQNLTQKLADARTALSESEVVYGKNHPNVKRLKSQVEELQAQVVMQRQAIIARIRTSYAAARAHEKLLAQEVRRTTDQGTQIGQYDMLKKEAQANRSLYDTLYTRVKEAGIAAELKSTNIRVVDRARILDIPTRPRRMLIMAVGLLVSLLGGVMVAFLKATFDNTIRDSDDLKKLTGISDVLRMPTFETKNDLGTTLRLPVTRLANGRNNGGQTEASRVIAAPLLLERPGSPEAEALRGLQASIMLRRIGNSPQVIQVISAFPGEGKTTIATNLAIALAGHGKTCLVDADLRRPSVAQSFGLTPRIGLREILMGTASLETALIHLRDIEGLSILPAATATGDTASLFISESMQAMLKALRQQFQHVVIDSPPLIAYADGRAIASQADGLILVGRCGVTTRAAMAQIMDFLTHINAAPVIEVVLNDDNQVALGSQYYYQTN